MGYTQRANEKSPQIFSMPMRCVFAMHSSGKKFLIVARKEEISMSTWFVVPSARPVEEASACLARWIAKGYRTAIWRDQRDYLTEMLKDRRDEAMVIVGAYPGYAAAMNLLQKAVFSRDPECNWIVAGGDDTDPDPHDPADIELECALWFGLLPGPSPDDLFDEMPPYRTDEVKRKSSFGVMQPTGDRFAQGSIDRICGSPWLGREFCRRMYQGKGPYFAGGQCHVCCGTGRRPASLGDILQINWTPCDVCNQTGSVKGYSHMFVDEELQAVALKLGVLWQRPDLTHFHRHFQRDGETNNAIGKAPPPHLVEANSPAHWQYFQRLFKSRQACGFPGHEPLGAVAPGIQETRDSPDSSSTIQ